jgi:hypothetical protein
MPHYTNWGGISHSDKEDDSKQRCWELAENIYLSENSIFITDNCPST